MYFPRMCLGVGSRRELTDPSPSIIIHKDRACLDLGAQKWTHHLAWEAAMSQEIVKGMVNALIEDGYWGGNRLSLFGEAKD